MDFDVDKIKELIENIRSEDETIKRKTISQIPSLILTSFEKKIDILDQLILIIYNLNCDGENYELFNESNKIIIIRNLLRLYTNSITEHELDQIKALKDLIKHSEWSSEILVELAYVLHKCNGSTTKEASDIVDEALEDIEERAGSNLYSDALLMIHTIKSQPLFLTS